MNLKLKYVCISIIAIICALVIAYKIVIDYTQSASQSYDLIIQDCATMPYLIPDTAYKVPGKTKVCVYVLYDGKTATKDFNTGLLGEKLSELMANGCLSVKNGQYIYTINGANRILRLKDTAVINEANRILRLKDMVILIVPVYVAIDKKSKMLEYAPQPSMALECN